VPFVSGQDLGEGLESWMMVCNMNDSGGFESMNVKCEISEFVVLFSNEGIGQ
jgi:hypothetical protein